jgi:hypothetical protein
MIIHVVHDRQGNIRSLVVPGPDFGDLEVVPSGGEQVSKVEGPDLQDDKLIRHLHNLRNRFRIDIRSRGLVRRR